MRKLAFLFLSLFAFCTASAQVTTSSMSGRVADTDGQPIIGATIVAVHTPTGTQYATASTRNGQFNLGGMRVGGPYDVEVSFIGCNTEKIEGIYLTIGEEATLDFVLREDSQSIGEVVVVGKANPVFNANRTGAQEVVTLEMMEKLPTTSRSLDEFVKLTPMSSGKNFAGTSYRFNNVTVDGASFNNSFGLSSALGAQGTEPISLESIEQVQVMIAPYDVRNGGFTGGGINSVTKSGTNEWHASAYMYTKSPELQGRRVRDYVGQVSEFSNRQYGVSLSGPIVKNKLFFFVNGELDRQDEPISNRLADSRVSAADLDDLAKFLGDQFNYNPGGYDLSKTETRADRLTARIDWNINDRNTFSLKYYYLKSYNTNAPSTSGAPANGRGPNAYAMPFSSSYYRTNNDFNIVMADWNSTINDHMSNTLKVGYSRLRDYRDMDGGFFPQVDILKDGSSYTVFGTEANSYNNQLDTDIFQIQDNFTMNYGRHQITVGTQSDYRSFSNGFAQNYPGSWVFSSIDDFKFNVLAAKDYMASHGNMTGFDITKYDPSQFGLKGVVNGGLANSAGTGQTHYLQKYSLMEGFPFAEIDVLQLGFYVQDKWTPSNRFSLTFGLRVDMPIFMTDLPENPRVAAETYRDGIKVDVSKYPGVHPQFSPRVGFNWKPLEDGSLQLRGGTGLFTGTPPYVWISNQAGNNGVLFGSIDMEGEALKNLGFLGSIDQNANMYKPAEAAYSRAEIAVTDPDFKYPSLWKSNLALDYKWRGWVFTLEALYTKDVNAIYHDNIGIEVAEGKYVNDGGQGQRTAFTGRYYAENKTLNPMNGENGAASHVVMLRNTNKGYSFYTTLQIQKEFVQGPLRGLYLNGSYTMGTARSVTDGTSSVATSAWKYTQKVAVNSEELGYSAGSFDGRLLLSAFYTARWGKHGATNFGLVYQRYRPFRFSYCYGGDANGDGQTANDLIYVPANRDEAVGHLVSDGFADNNGNMAGDKDFDEAQAWENAWQAMDKFIEQDAYLSKHRGEYTKRNGAVAPFANQLDLSISHDIIVPQRNGREHKLRFSFNIDNFLNLLNRNWGVSYSQYLGTNGQQYQFLSVTQKPTAANDYTLQYKMTNGLKDIYGNDISLDRTYKPEIGSYCTRPCGNKYLF